MSKKNIEPELDPKLDLDLEMMGAPSLLMDVKPGPKFVWLRMNHAAEQYMGCTVDELGSPDLDDLQGLNATRIEQRKKFRQVCAQCFEGKSPVTYDARYQRPDGGYRWSRNYMVPMLDKDKEIRRIFSSFVDITDFIKTQQHLDDCKRQLKEAMSKTLDGFVVICCECKNICDEGQWLPIETYVGKHLDFHQFTHGMCPSCEQSLYIDEK